jgi:antirestriction protein
MLRSLKTDIPKIYVACLSSYNNGILFGEWIECDLGAESIQESIKEMLSKSPMKDAEEWAIHDVDNFYGINISEFENIEKVAQIAEMLENTDYESKLIAEVYQHLSIEPEDVLPWMEDNYYGKYESLADFAEEWLDNSGQLNGTLKEFQYYFDFDLFAKEVLMNDFFEIDLGYREKHIFMNH